MQNRKAKELESACREHGLSMTIQRRAILDNLSGRNDHPTADQIYEVIRDQLKGVSRTTVYRVLETLVGVGLARKVSNPDSKARFDADTSRHHHLSCVGCGEIFDVHDPELNELEMPEQLAGDFEFIDYSISFSGRCKKCRNADHENRRIENEVH